MCSAWWAKAQEWPSFKRGLHDLISEAEFAEMKTHGPEDPRRSESGLRGWPAQPDIGGPAVTAL